MTTYTILCSFTGSKLHIAEGNRAYSESFRTALCGRGRKWAGGYVGTIWAPESFCAQCLKIVGRSA